MVEAALQVIGTRQPQEARVLHIRNTLSLEELEVSEPCLAGVRSGVRLTPLGEARPPVFDAAGNLKPI